MNEYLLVHKYILTTNDLRIHTLLWVSAFHYSIKLVCYVMTNMLLNIEIIEKWKFRSSKRRTVILKMSHKKMAEKYH